MLVVLYHLVSAGEKYFSKKPFQGIFEFGWVGVDFFFVLSGFIIMFIHYRDIISKGNWINFLKKRAIRIYPIYWIVATLTFIIYVFIAHGNIRDELMFNLYSSDSWIYLLKQYLLIYQQPYMVSVAWSLTYEIFFYLIFAVCIFCGWRISKYITLLWVVAIALKSITNSSLLSSFIFSSANYEFLLGCLVGYLFYKKYFISLTNAMILFGIVVSLFVFYLEYFDINSNLIISKLFLGLLSAIIIWVSASIDYNNTYNREKIKLLIIIGDSSYSLYLIHSIVLSTLCRFFAKFNFYPEYVSINSDLLFLIIFITTVVIGLIFHFFIEKRVLSYFTNNK